MKKLALLLFLTSTILLISCSSDDDAPFVVDESLIPGEWTLTEIKSENGKITATVGVVPVSGDYSVTGKDYTAKATFTESTVENEPNTVVSSGGFTVVATVTIPMQDPVTEERPVPEFISNTAEWTVNGNSLTIKTEVETISYEITALSAQSMTIKVTLDEEETFQGIDFKISGDQFFTLTKA